MSTAIPLFEEILELRDELRNYKTGDASESPDQIDLPPNFYIGLFGKTGCGKTSLINSIKFAADGKLRKSKWLPVAPQDKAGGHTMHRQLAYITDHIFLIDNRGLDDPSTGEAIEELTAQLDGKRSCDEIVRWQKVDKGADDDLDLEKSDVHDQHPIGCAVLVLSALHDHEDNTTGLIDLIDFLRMHQGRYPLTVITHVDVADEILVKKLCTILHMFGVSDIFKVVNLTQNRRKLDEDSQLSALNLMHKCMVECKWRELKRSHDLMLECARTGMQRHLAAKMRDSFVALERERETALKRERVAALERERVAALERERVAVLERERSEAQGREKVAVLERERSEAQGRERETALKRERMAALERERMVALERERVAALEREKVAVLERERSDAQEREMMAALERERMVALERERVAVLGRERSEAQGREREAALEDTIMRMKTDMQIMDFDEKLKTVAKSFVNPNEVDDLGKALGFKPDDITPYIATNSKGEKVSSWGTLLMLRDWRKKQTKAKECGALKEALEEAGQIHLADELFGIS